MNIFLKVDTLSWYCSNLTKRIAGEVPSVLAKRKVREVPVLCCRPDRGVQHAPVHPEGVQGDGRPRREFKNPEAVPVHGLAWTGSAQVGRRLHRLHRTGSQDEGAVRSGRPYHCSLQVTLSTNNCNNIEILIAYKYIVLC